MNRTQPSARTTLRGPRRLLGVGLLVAAMITAVVVSAVLLAAPGHEAPKSWRSSLSAGPSLSGSAGLDPELLDALRRAASAASDDGVEFHVNSGRRSPEDQDRLFREAVAKYGSEEEAARWVATAATSPHVSGDAVDIGRSDATAWLSEHGSAYGLCQIYRNEPWHYELRTEAIGSRCPRMYADPTQDPRMRR
ncbi:M15 family metallopeptidase [Streptomyces sp. NPDC050732]|uniref:M15 family metallopeptidase n=1 Tax=Streptomyces sp. NPDC050732 TaxID=3154632 RepID=UPI00341B1B0F